MKPHLFCSFFISMIACCLSANADNTRPAASEQQVKVGFVLVDIHHVDNVGQSITGEFIIFAQWHDSSLVAPGQNSTVNLPLEEAGPPAIQIKGLENLQTFRKNTVSVAADGSIQYRHRFIGTIRHTFRFRDFPFDTQHWSVVLYYSGPKDFALVADHAHIGRMEEVDITIDNWEVAFAGAEISEVESYDTPIQTLVVTYQLQRNAVFYIWKVMIPVVLIVLMSWSVFWISPSNISAQLTVAVTAILTLIAFQFSVSQLMPPLPYLTKLDRFTIGADIFVFLAFVETIVTSHYENRGKINTAVVIDHYAKFIFPAAFILFTIVCLW